MQKKNHKKFGKYNLLIFFLQNRAFLLVMIFFILLTLSTDTFLTKGNLMSLIRQIAANGIIGVGYTFLLASDSVDLSAGYMMCMIGIIGGLLSQTGMPFPLLLLICVVIAICCSSTNAIIENKFGLPPFLVTLAMQQIFRGVLMLLSNGSPISGLNEGILFMGQGYVGPIPFSVLLMLVFIIAGHIIFSRTQFGRNVIAVGCSQSIGYQCRTNQSIRFGVTWIYYRNHGYGILRTCCISADNFGRRHCNGYYCSGSYRRHSYGRWLGNGRRNIIRMSGNRSDQ